MPRCCQWSAWGTELQHPLLRKSPEPALQKDPSSIWHIQLPWLLLNLIKESNCNLWNIIILPEALHSCADRQKYFGFCVYDCFWTPSPPPTDEVVQQEHTLPRDCLVFCIGDLMLALVLTGDKQSLKNVAGECHQHRMGWSSCQWSLTHLKM